MYTNTYTFCTWIFIFILIFFINISIYIIFSRSLSLFSREIKLHTQIITHNQPSSVFAFCLFLSWLLFLINGRFCYSLAFFIFGHILSNLVMAMINLWVFFLLFLFFFIFIVLYAYVCVCLWLFLCELR